jgi:two-component system, OmpR family, sensor kinase
MTMHLKLKARVLLWHVATVGLILVVAAMGADLVFSRMVLGQFDQALLDLAQTEAAATLADPARRVHVHEMPPGTAPPSFPRLDKFIQIVDLDGGVVARSGNLGIARLPTPPALLARLRGRERVFETLRDFGDEPVRLLSVPLEIDGARYAIQVAGSLDDADAVLRGARWLFLAMSAAILAAVTLTGAMLARAVLRPIDRIVSRARVMGATALAERLPRPGSRDEMARLVDTLNEMLARIEQVFEAQRRFTADASHELRSPLSRLRTELEMTLRRSRDPVEYQEALQSCLSEVERLSRLTDGLLTLARLEAGEARQAPMQSVPLTLILGEVMRRLAPEARRREVALVVDAGDELAVKVTPAAADLVVANVLDNAVKFSPPGGQVRIRVATEEGAAVVAVSDSGPGVPEEEVPRLFERFFRGSAARGPDTPGVGLGLAICRLLVEAQGGGISIASAPGGGATVRVRLPLAS